MRAPTFFDSTFNSKPSADLLSDDGGGGGALPAGTVDSTAGTAARWGAAAGERCSLDLSVVDGLVFCNPGLVRRRGGKSEVGRQGEGRHLTYFDI